MLQQRAAAELKLTCADLKLTCADLKPTCTDPKLTAAVLKVTAAVLSEAVLNQTSAERKATLVKLTLPPPTAHTITGTLDPRW